MPFWKRKKVISTSTSVSRFIEDESLPDTSKEALLNAIFTKTKISEAVIEAYTDTMVSRVERAFEYAKTRYHYGTPSQLIDAGPSIYNPIRGYVEGIKHPGELMGDLLYLRDAPVSHIHHALFVLQAQPTLGWDSLTNTLPGLSAEIGVTAYLEDITPIYRVADLSDPVPAYVSQFGSRPVYTYATPWREENSAWQPEPTVKITSGSPGAYVWYCYADPVTGAYTRDRLRLTMTEMFSNAASAMQFIYTLESGRVGVEIYLRNQSIPILETVPVTTGSAPKGAYFPFIFFRHNDQNRTASEFHSSNAYKTSVELCKIMNMDYQALGDAINANPDADKLEQAYLTMAVPINATHMAQKKYLYRFFEAQYLETDTETFRVRRVPTYDEYAAHPYTIELDDISTVLRDADTEMHIKYYAIQQSTHNIVGAENRYYTSTGTVTKVFPLVYTDDYGDTVTTTVSLTMSVFTVEAQITPVLRRRYTVYGLANFFLIRNGRGESGTYEDGTLMVPLDMALVNGFTFREKEVLYSASLNFVFNAYVEQRLKWYQTGLFKAVIVVAAVVVTVLTAGSAWQAIALAASIGAVAVVLTVTIILLKIIIARYVFKKLVEELGLENSFFAAVLLFVAAIYFKIDNSFQPEFFDPDVALSVATNLTVAMDSVVVDELSDIQNQMEEQERIQGEKMDELKAVQDDLNFDSLINPMLVLVRKPLELRDEGPDDFFRRTIHSGNPGVKSKDFASNYVSAKLRLPTVEQTTRGLV